MEQERDARRTALTLIVVLAPFLLAGVLLTVSLFGAFFGVPLLLLTVPPTLVAWRVRGSPSDCKRLRHLGFASTFVAAALTLTIVALVVVGLDDLDTPPEFAALVAAAGWAGAAWWVAQRTRTLTATPQAHQKACERFP